MVLVAIARAELGEDVALLPWQYAHVSNVRRASAGRGEKIFRISPSARFDARDLRVGMAAESRFQPCASVTWALPGPWHASHPMPSSVHWVR